MDSAAFCVQFEILGGIAVAMVLGALIGLERELADKPAGFRTHMLVAGAAALIVSLGEALVTQFGKEFTGDLIRSDPIRIIEAITVGVSFIGAGTIIRRARAQSVEGLTTAASLLFTAGVGISVALSQWLLAVGATILALVALRVVRFVERRLLRSSEEKRAGREQ